MEIMSRSLRLERGSSLRLGRSNSSVLVSELVSSDISRITSYERLSKSMRLSSAESGGFHRRRKSRAWAFLSKVFSFRRIDGEGAAENEPKPPQAAAEKQNKRRSSWLPDPHRRWPVQGW
ncbi:hypothetical protein ACSBR2_009684 [Camellia fascicularis]